MKNKLLDLNNHLFAQMERLSEEDLKGDDLKAEIDRSKAVSQIATQIIGNANLSLKAAVAINEGLLKKPPAQLGLDGYEEE